MNTGSSKRFARPCRVAAVAGSLVLIGCAPKPEEKPNRLTSAKTAEVVSGEPDVGKTVHVGVLLAEEKPDTVLRTALEHAGKADDMALDVHTIRRAGGPEASPQTAIIDRWQEEHTDAVLLCAPDTDFALPAWKRAGEHGLAVIVMDPKFPARTAPTAGKLPGSVSRVAFAPGSVADLAGEKLAALLHGKGGIVQILPAKSAPDAEKLAEVRQALARHPGVKTLAALPSLKTSTEALKVLQKFGATLNGVLCADMAMIRLWAETCRKVRRPDVVFACFDAHHATVTTLHNGDSQTYRFSASPEMLSQTAIKTVEGYLRGEKVQPTVLVEPTVVLVDTTNRK